MFKFSKFGWHFESKQKYKLPTSFFQHYFYSLSFPHQVFRFQNLKEDWINASYLVRSLEMESQFSSIKEEWRHWFVSAITLAGTGALDNATDWGSHVASSFKPLQTCRKASTFQATLTLLAFLCSNKNQAKRQVFMSVFILKKGQ